MPRQLSISRRLPLPVVVLGLLSLVLGPLVAAPEPTLGKKGKLLVEENFDAAKLPPNWTRNTGTLSVADGVLHAAELKADNHIGAFRRPVPIQDCAVQLDFRLEGARVFHVGFDPAPGELKKQGHLFALIITPTGWSINEQNNKADPASKPIVRAKATTAFARGQWHTLLLEMKGETVIAHVDGRPPLKASAPDFRVKKPGLVFRVGGPAPTDEVLIDNVKVWTLE
ncbi:MAG: hypothetical protein HZA93_11330 [Verrucomicrobia bacterium]|nr:hypothetical protein [Verrucomicrobiota bacterium]